MIWLNYTTVQGLIFLVQSFLLRQCFLGVVEVSGEEGCNTDLVCYEK